jgi:hypothetical protein
MASANSLACSPLNSITCIAISNSSTSKYPLLSSSNDSNKVFNSCNWEPDASFGAYVFFDFNQRPTSKRQQIN